MVGAWDQTRGRDRILWSRCGVLQEGGVILVMCTVG